MPTAGNSSGRSDTKKRKSGQQRTTNSGNYLGRRSSYFIMAPLSVRAHGHTHVPSRTHVQHAACVYAVRRQCQQYALQHAGITCRRWTCVRAIATGNVRASITGRGSSARTALPNTAESHSIQGRQQASSGSGEGREGGRQKHRGIARGTLRVVYTHAGHCSATSHVVCCCTSQ
jgi:hypothetical protein